MNICRYTTNVVAVRCWLGDDRSDLCEHVTADSSCAHGLYSEDDSFGPLIRSVMCKQCYEAAIQERDSELTRCHDCGKDLPLRDVFPWRWYDFYAAQGDEPLHICNSCWDKPKHVARMRKDDEARAREDSWYESSDD